MSSILDDIRYQYDRGDRITRLIMVNVGVFLAFTILAVFARFSSAGGLYTPLLKIFALSGDFIDVILRPWSLITHMFLHTGIWHLLWNMLFLYWFGRRVEDLLGQRHIYWLYFYGGLASAITLLLSVALFGYMADPTATMAYGASGAVMAFVVAAAVLNPEAEMHLILIGPVKMKYIAAAIVLIDLIALSSYSNTGGHFGHLGGAAMGWLYIYALHTGWDLRPLGLIRWVNGEQKPSRRPTVEVTTPRARRSAAAQQLPTASAHSSQTDEIDRILDKIASQGISSLSKEEKDTLDRASRS